MSDRPESAVTSLSESSESYEASHGLIASRRPATVDHIPDPMAKPFSGQLLSRDSVSDAELVRAIYEDGKSQRVQPARYWERPVKKILVTLNINNYQPAIRELTYPLMYQYAQKIGAEFREITERKSPDLPIVMEKLQCADICREQNADWVIFFDADALISPEMFDVTDHLTKDTVCFNGKDISGIRSRSDKYFRRDGRWLGACSWFMVASDWCASDLWHPLDDLTFEEAKQNMFLSIQEHNGGQFKDNHLIDDYVHSRNISRYGLKHRQLMSICGEMGFRDANGRPVNPWLWHSYSIPEEQKLENMVRLLSTPQQQFVDIGGVRTGPGWQLLSIDDATAFRKKWGLK